MVIAKLKFLFALPSTLQSHIEAKDFAAAVEAYCESKEPLERFKDMTALRAVYNETNAIVANLKDILLDSFRSSAMCGAELAGRVQLLLKLGEQPASLAYDYLASSMAFLRQQLNDTNDGGSTTNAEAFSFVDALCCTFLGNVSLLVTSWRSMFSDVSEQALIEEVSQLLTDYIGHCEKRFLVEPFSPSRNGALLARALDRFYRRLLAFDQVITLKSTVGQAALDLIVSVADHHIQLIAQSVMDAFDSSVHECQRLVVAQGKQPLTSAVALIEPTLVANLKSGLAYLLHLTSSDLSFMLPNNRIAPQFATDVKNHFFVNVFRHILETCQQYTNPHLDRNTTGITMVLIVCKFCVNCSETFVHAAFNLYQRHFCQYNSNDTEKKDLDDSLQSLSRLLLYQYVMLEGFQLSQMLAKSTETRDWMGNVEPRSVRSAVKRIVEDLHTIDDRIGQLFEEGQRKEVTVDGSRRASVANYSRNLRSWNADGATFGSTFEKLWTDRVEYVIQVEFNRISIMTGIVKICLKTLLEIVRMKTYGKFGLQQIQADCHYLQLHLWRFVSDESVMLSLLDEVVSSAVVRCVDPHLMDPGLVSLLCERE